MENSTMKRDFRNIVNCKFYYLLSEIDRNAAHNLVLLYSLSAGANVCAGKLFVYAPLVSQNSYVIHIFRNKYHL